MVKIIRFTYIKWVFIVKLTYTVYVAVSLLKYFYLLVIDMEF